MTIAVLGASGQLGSLVIEAVLSRDIDPGDVVAAVRSPEKISSWQERGIQIRRADYDLPETLVTAFSGVEKLLLIPSLALPVDRVRQYDNGISAAKQAGVAHLVHFGLVPTHIEAPFAMSPFMLYAESALRISGLEWTILRNGLYADPIADWMADIVKMGTIPYPTADGRCSYVTRHDIARAAAAVLTTDGHQSATYNLTGPEALTTADLCDVVARVTGHPVVDRGATDQDYIDVCLQAGEPEGFTHILLSLYHTIRQGYLDLVSDDIFELTGERPRTLEEFLTERRQSA